MIITPLYAAILALIFIALSVRTFRLRHKLRIAIGDKGNEEMLRAMRVHANFAEYTPITLLLVLMLELLGGYHWLIHALGLCLLIGRIVHAYGVSQLNENYRFRTIGMAMTFSALLLAALGILGMYLKSV